MIVLGDQLSVTSAAFDGFDRAHDLVWMAEVREETEHVRCHQLRIAVFLSAMRHFRRALEDRGLRVRYSEMPADSSADRGATFGAILTKDIRDLHPEKLVVVHPGDHRVSTALQKTAAALAVELEIRPDRHFYASLDEFDAWAEGRAHLLLETFYEHIRKRHRVLVDESDRPEGNRWSLDAENREPFAKRQKGAVPGLPRFPPDSASRAVLAMVRERFADHPGSVDDFGMPVTRADAQAFLRDFLDHRLAEFGPYEDAMWTDEPFLFHSRLSLLLNLKLLDPRECVDGAVEQYQNGRAPLRSVEGFVRQILGWREFVRGIYWRHMPGYLEKNALECKERDVPAFLWDGQTDMNCAAHAMRTVVAEGYAHHIQRLMVLGNLCLLAGVHPRRFHEWHMAMHLDAVDCPYNALYWNFLAQHRHRFEANARMNLVMKSLSRKSELKATRKRAQELLDKLDRGERL